MKLAHVGDLHLGKYLNDFDLKEDQEYILNQILSIMERESVDGILIAGDVYDKSIPSEAATRLLGNFLNRLVTEGYKVFMISGNHDSDERLNYGSTLFSVNCIYISAIYDGTLYKQTVTDEFGEIDVYLLPFVKASQVRHFFPGAKIENYEDAVRVILENANVDPERRNILVAHQFVIGKSEDPKLSGSEGPGTLAVGLVEKIGYDCFDAFDYVALGHIHSPQRVGREEVRYSGSPLKYSLSEAGNEKSVPIITFGNKGDVTIELIPLIPKRDLRHIKGELRTLLDPSNVVGTDDFIYATLTDEDIINDAMGIFQQTYPNTVRIDYDNSHTKEVAYVHADKELEKKPFGELISEFYEFMYGVAISEEELAVMKEAAKEAGVIDETD